MLFWYVSLCSEKEITCTFHPGFTDTVDNRLTVPLIPPMILFLNKSGFLKFDAGIFAAKFGCLICFVKTLSLPY